VPLIPHIKLQIRLLTVTMSLINFNQYGANAHKHFTETEGRTYSDYFLPFNCTLNKIEGIERNQFRYHVGRKMCHFPLANTHFFFNFYDLLAAPADESSVESISHGKPHGDLGLK
jgi:hypothetical protein